MCWKTVKSTSHTTHTKKIRCTLYTYVAWQQRNDLETLAQHNLCKIALFKRDCMYSDNIAGVWFIPSISFHCPAWLLILLKVHGKGDNASIDLQTDWPECRRRSQRERERRERDEQMKVGWCREGRSNSWDGRAGEEISNNSTAGRQERAEKKVIHAAKRIMPMQSNERVRWIESGESWKHMLCFPACTIGTA